MGDHHIFVRMVDLNHTEIPGIFLGIYIAINRPISLGLAESHDMYMVPRDEAVCLAYELK